jgi:hypothetical protein
MTYINNNPKRPPTLDELIELAKQDVEKFKVIMETYPKQNPTKALAKADELVKKLEVKEQKLQDLINIKDRQSAAVREKEAMERKRQDDLEAAHQAELAQAREEGAARARKEWEKEREKEREKDSSK